MYKLSDISTGRIYCRDIKGSKLRLPLLLFCILFALAELSETKTIENIILVRPINPTNHVIPRRQVRYLIRNNSLNNKKQSIANFVEGQDRILVEQIRSRRKSLKRPFRIRHIVPTNRRTVRLKSKTGFFLEILPNGKVSGHVNKTKYTKLELQVITNKVKRIKGLATGRYLAINKEGKVISKDRCDKETYFFEELSESLDHLYYSVRHPLKKTGLQWYLGLKKNKNRIGRLQGRTKRASRTLPGENATHFSVFMEH